MDQTVAPMREGVGPRHFSAWDGTPRGKLGPLGAEPPLPGVVGPLQSALHGFADYSASFALPARFWAANGIATFASPARNHQARWSGSHAICVGIFFRRNRSASRW